MRVFSKWTGARTPWQTVGHKVDPVTKRASGERAPAPASTQKPHPHRGEGRLSQLSRTQPHRRLWEGDLSKGSLVPACGKDPRPSVTAFVRALPETCTHKSHVMRQIKAHRSAGKPFWTWGWELPMRAIHS